MAPRSLAFGPVDDASMPAPVAWISAEDPAAAVSYCRVLFPDHHAITQIPALTIRVAPGHEAVADAVCGRLRCMMDELGNSVEDAWEGIDAAVRNAHAFGVAATSESLEGRYAGQPAICLAAGPSAAAHIEAIRASHPGARLFVCDAMSAACAAAGIVPDYVCTVERCVGQDHVNRPGTGWSVIAPLSAYHLAAKKYAEHCWWLTADPFVSWILQHPYRPQSACHSSGTMTVAAALVAGCSPIYLVGHDLTFGTDGATHSAGASPLAQAFRDVVSDAAPQLQYQRIERDGWQTTYIWDMFARNIEDWLRVFPGVRAYRVGAGLPIAGTETVDALPAFADLALSPPQGARPRPIRPLAVGLTHAAARMASIARRANLIRRRLDDGAEVEPAAERLALSSIVPGGEHNPLCAYLLQTLYSAMHVRLATGADYRRAVRRLAVTLDHHATILADRMRMLADEVGP